MARMQSDFTEVEVSYGQDVLVLATGFRVDSFVRPMRVAGDGGVVLDDVWSDGPFAGHNPFLPFWATGVTPPDVKRMADPAVSARVRKAAHEPEIGHRMAAAPEEAVRAEADDRQWAVLGGRIEQTLARELGEATIGDG